MARVIYPVIPSFFVQTKFDSTHKIRSVAIPKLFFHSLDDCTVPYRLGRKLFDAAQEPKTWVELAGDHNDNHLVSQKIIKEALERFLQDNHFIKDYV